ncbi:MAG: NAD(P)-dependent glycerol-3-phosphate dehydrogenase [Candidatus Omnitrophica bacterium]|nr:NAD(P)-dependent glycerol-3-phosphate dehydrogenase [Candidatus Omnitrophota bacterium]
MKITILGDGGWGTALAVMLAHQGKQVLIWSAFAEYAREIDEKRENRKFLPGVSLTQEIKISSNLEESIRFGETVVFAIPTQFLRNVLYKTHPSWFEEKIIVSVAKGLEKKTLLRPSEIILAHVPHARLVVFSGPSHAEEVARFVPTCLVAASPNPMLARFIQTNLSDENFRIYTSDDMIGVELGGALKNVIALAVGIAEGLGLGENTKAALMTRGMIEIARLGIRMGAQANTFFGLSGIGDLITTCFSPFGRNLKVGVLLGQGKTVEEITKSMEMVAEGVFTVEAADEIARKYQVEMPIIHEIFDIVSGRKKPEAAVSSLMKRKLRPEFMGSQKHR